MIDPNHIDTLDSASYPNSNANQDGWVELSIKRDNDRVERKQQNHNYVLLIRIEIQKRKKKLERDWNAYRSFFG